MSVRIGLIGAGVMGGDHARIISSQIHGGELAVICDADQARSRAVADATGCRRTATDPHAVINDAGVDAILIASPDQTHGPLTLACLAAGKPVLCEKPLSQSSDECLQILAEEARGGHHLVQVGFMRRFDQAYLDMRAALTDGTIGRALMFHCFHRNVAAPSWFTGQMAITNSAPHEFDIVRFVLATEFRSISVFQPRMPSPQGGTAPVFITAETAEGQIANIEVNNNAAYGYDVRGELVGEKGAVSMRDPIYSTIDVGLAHRAPYAPDWRGRFAEAYRRQNQAWVDAIRSGRRATGASAWDGYCAALVAETAVRALEQGQRCTVQLAARPPFYGEPLR